MTLIVKPVSLKDANFAVWALHRHHKPVVGHRWSLGCYDDDRWCGVVICGRPVARMCDQETTLEILRCATDGTPNAISKLYGAVYRAAKAMGFLKLQTYTLSIEGGSSLRASGFTFDGEFGGGDWNVPSRGGRRTDQPQMKKYRWSKVLK